MVNCFPCDWYFIKLVFNSKDTDFELKNNVKHGLIYCISKNKHYSVNPN